MSNDDNRPIGVWETLKATPTAVRYLLTGVLVNQLCAFVQTFLVLYLTVRGASFALAGVCLAAYSVGAIFGTLLGGELTHRFGPRLTIVAAMGCSAPLVASIPWVRGPALVGVVALAGLATQAYRPAAAVLLSDLMPQRFQVMAFSMMRTALNIGAAVAPLIAAGVILLDWDLLFWLDGATALAYAALAFTLLPRHVSVDVEPEPAAAVDTRGSAYAAMLRDTRFLLYLGAVLLGTLTYLQSMTTLPLEIVSDGYPTGLYSAVLTISSVTLITCELKITTYVTRMPAYFAAFLGHAVNGIGLAAYALAAQAPAFVVAGAALVVIGLMVGGPSMFAHPAQFPAAVKARYVSTMQAVVGVASALGPVLGVLAWHALPRGAFWLGCGAVTVLAGVFAFAGLRRDADQPDERTADHDDRPVVVVGFVAVTLGHIAKFQPANSVIFVEEPDVVRKRHVRDKVAGLPFVRELIEWEYGLGAGKADEFYDAHPDLRPAAIIPAIEYATPFAARLAERYGLPGAGLDAALTMRDKAQLRRVSTAAGIPGPESATVDGPAGVLAFMRERPGPVVLKPANRQASVGTRVIHHAAEVEPAWADCVAQDEGIFVPDRPMELRMLVERYVNGPEYSVEMLVRDGEALFVNVTEKRLFPGPCPVELAHAVPAGIPPDLATKLTEQTARVLDAVSFRTGIVHCEWIVSGGVAYLVECAGRLAGDGILDIIERAYPVPLLRAYYAVMKGEPPPELPQEAGHGAAVWFLTGGPGVVKNVRGVEEARQAEGVFLVDVVAKEGDELTGLRHSWDRVGVVMTSADTAAEALRLAEAAAALIQIEARETVVVGGQA
jgi:biotin carboxylase/MFS family permease